jgi:hypothetical protein
LSSSVVSLTVSASLPKSLPVGGVARSIVGSFATMPQ